MSRKPSVFLLPASLVLTLVAVTACAPVSAHPIGGSVRVLGTWKGAEREAFLDMVAPFEAATGITVEYTGTDDLSGKLWKSVATHDLPDVSGLPGPGEMRELAEMGALVNLSDAIDLARYKAETAPAFVELGTVDDRVSGIFIKGTVKGLMWFNPRVFSLAMPQSWDELQRAARISARGGTKQWCLGLESGDASGWPATDWIEDILLRQSGPAVYDDWVAGKLKWASSPVRRAFETFGQVVAPNATAGGTAAVLATNFAAAGNGLFSDPPECLFLHQASFMPPLLKRGAGAREGEFDFFPFPTIDPRFADSLIVAGDLFGMFRDTPQSRALMSYLVSAEAQAIRVRAGGALSVNVDVDDYPDDISRREAELLRAAKHVRFDASDLMPDAMNSAFLQATLEFARDQSRLDEILAQLDRASTGPGRP